MDLTQILAHTSEFNISKFISSNSLTNEFEIYKLDKDLEPSLVDYVFNNIYKIKFEVLGVKHEIIYEFTPNNDLYVNGKLTLRNVKQHSNESTGLYFLMTSGDLYRYGIYDNEIKLIFNDVLALGDYIIYKRDSIIFNNRKNILLHHENKLENKIVKTIIVEKAHYLKDEVFAINELNQLIKFEYVWVSQDNIEMILLRDNIPDIIEVINYDFTYAFVSENSTFIIPYNKPQISLNYKIKNLVEVPYKSLDEIKMKIIVLDEHGILHVLYEGLDEILDTPKIKSIKIHGYKLLISENDEVFILLSNLDLIKLNLSNKVVKFCYSKLRKLYCLLIDGSVEVINDTNYKCDKMDLGEFHVRDMYVINYSMKKIDFVYLLTKCDLVLVNFITDLPKRLFVKDYYIKLKLMDLGVGTPENVFTILDQVEKIVVGKNRSDPVAIFFYTRK